MHKLALILISALSLASSSALAASYQQTDGTIVDPILYTALGGGGDGPQQRGALTFGPVRVVDELDPTGQIIGEVHRRGAGDDDDGPEAALDCGAHGVFDDGSAFEGGGEFVPRSVPSGAASCGE